MKFLMSERVPVRRANPREAAASEAARTLAIRRQLAGKREGSDRRTQTGVFGCKRGWIGQQVVLPDQSVGWVKRARAGQVCARTSGIDPEDGPVHQYLKASQLRPYKMPEAVLLGWLKRGKKERKSHVARLEAVPKTALRLLRKTTRPFADDGADLGGDGVPTKAHGT